MRILHVLGSLDIGGAETFIMNIYRKIIDFDIQFDFVVHSNKKGFFEDEVITLGGKIYRVPRYKVYNHFKYKKAWSRLLVNENYDVLHSHVRSTAKIFLKIAQSIGIITLLHSHSTTDGYGVAALIKRFYRFNISRNADYKLACSLNAGKWLFGSKELNKNFKIIKNPIDLDFFQYDAKIEEEVRMELGLKGKRIIGHVGRFIHLKNHKKLIKIYKKIKMLDPNVDLVLIGNGKLFESIQQLVKKQNIVDVHFLGSKSNVRDYMMIFDVLLFPSIKEGFPVTLIEAQSLGIKCIVSDNITKEVQLTDLIQFVSLKDSENLWASKVLSCFDYQKSNVYNSIVKRAGYESTIIASEVGDFYHEIITK